MSCLFYTASFLTLSKTYWLNKLVGLLKGRKDGRQKNLIAYENFVSGGWVDGKHGKLHPKKI